MLGDNFRPRQEHKLAVEQALSRALSSSADKGSEIDLVAKIDLIEATALKALKRN
jgi:hypothetical protein